MKSIILVMSVATVISAASTVIRRVVFLSIREKPYQRPELRHAGPTSVNREAELEPPSRVACSERLCEKSVMFFETFTPEGGLIQA
jgi:hypothetical protein